MDQNIVVTTLQSLSTDMISLIKAVVPAGVGIMSVFLGFKYGKRIFFGLAK